jgi:hypothetical protein
MFSTKFWIIFGIALIALLFSYFATVVLSHGTWWHWFYYIWIDVLAVSLGAYISIGIFMYWDTPILTEGRMPFYLALGVSLLLSGIHQGVIHFLK